MVCDTGVASHQKSSMITLRKLMDFLLKSPPIKDADTISERSLSWTG